MLYWTFLYICFIAEEWTESLTVILLDLNGISIDLFLNDVNAHFLIVYIAFILCVCWAGSKYRLSWESKNVSHPKMHVIHYSWIENFTFPSAYLLSFNLNSMINLIFEWTSSEPILIPTISCITDDGPYFLSFSPRFPSVIMCNSHCGQWCSLQPQSNENLDIVHDGFPIQR